MDEIVKYFLVLFISYLGLLAGIIISNMAKEELTPGKRYFGILKSLIFGIILFQFFSYIKISYFISIPLSIIMGGLSYFWEKRMSEINMELWYYSFYAIILFETKKTDFFPILALLIFIYGIIVSSIKSEQLEELKLFQKITSILSQNIIFLIMGIFLSFLFKS